MQLNEQQYKAANLLNGPVSVIAGAGSGKTRVLAVRFNNILLNNIYGSKILTLTFTNKSAKEMKDRIEKVYNDMRLDPNIEIKSDFCNTDYVCTFHSLAFKILCEDIDKLGYDRDFRIIDKPDKKNLIKKIISTKLGLNPNNFDIEELCSKLTITNKRQYRNSIEQQIYKIYISYCTLNSVLDFDDLLYITYKLFIENENVLRKWRDKFQYIMIDEFQDTNQIQLDIIKMLASDHKNVFIVGDEDQAIYSFRGAISPDNFNDFNDTYNPTIIKLEENYRSTKTILNLANKSIKNNRYRNDKTLFTQNEQGSKYEYFRAIDEDTELTYVAENIKFMSRRGLPLNNIAILYRSRVLASKIELKLNKYNIEYDLHSSTSFFQREEIKDTLTYLRLCCTPNDYDYLQVINKPKRNIGSKTIDKLYEYSFNIINDDTNWVSWIELSTVPGFDKSIYSDSGIDNNKIDSIIEFNKIIYNLSKNINKISIDELFHQFISTTRYLDLYDNRHTKQVKHLNIEDLKNILLENAPEDYSKNKEYITKFLREYAIEENFDVQENRKVNLMTMHSAKGLEFDVVFIVGLDENIIPSAKSVDNNNEEEERRLFYVAITRAKKKLFLTNSIQRFMYSKYKTSCESLFISELREV